MAEDFVVAGSKVDSIDVQISHRIIQLFSEGLYSSPNKAIEELVSNSFDARAENVHVILTPNLTDQDATIVVMDDGEGMDINGLKEHWIIGHSTRRNRPNNKGRKPIGKFGIGKLATYVLADKLTHICKINGKYYATTMDYRAAIPIQDRVDNVDQGKVFDEKRIALPIRELDEAEAKRILDPWINGSKPGYKAMKLFGQDASRSWTVAIMSTLKDMGRRIQRKRLTWIMRFAMPLRDDFHLFINGEPIKPSKINEEVIEHWVIGKDIVEDTLRSPCPDNLDLEEDGNEPEDSIHHFGLTHPKLGRITGYVDLFQNDLTTGKSAEIGRSNGFFVYVLGRMINIANEDDGFGIPRNRLRHGTFSRFRMVVHIDGLDKALRSSRESVMEGELYKIAQNFLHASFNLARNRLVEFEKTQSPSALLSERLSSVPGSVTRVPLYTLAKLVLEGKAHPVHMWMRAGLNDQQKQEFLNAVRETLDSPEKDVIQHVEYAQLDTNAGIAVFDIENNKLLINSSHPFVAAFQESYMKTSSGMPLELYAVAEILTEANLYYLDFNEKDIRTILELRDEILRTFTRSSIQRTPGMIALALLEAKNDSTQLEIEMRAAVEAIGFGNVIRIGGKGNPDGTAEAYLPANEDRKKQSFKLGLEAKSGGKVSAHRLGVSTLAKHMKDLNCDHELVIGNDFETSIGEESSTVKQIRELNNQKEHRTITLMLIDDLARLVKIVTTKRIDLGKIRELFLTCITPEETHAWIDEIEKIDQPRLPYKEILETIWDRAHQKPDYPVEYSIVWVKLEDRNPPIEMDRPELVEHCRTMAILAPGLVFAREDTVEIRSNPDMVYKHISAALNEPNDDIRNILL